MKTDLRLPILHWGLGLWDICFSFDNVFWNSCILKQWDNIHHKKLISICILQFFPARKGLKASRPKNHMIHQVIKGARTLQRESCALLKQSENRCFLHVRQVLFLNRYCRQIRIEINCNHTSCLREQSHVQDSASGLEWTRKQGDFHHQKYLKLLMAARLKEREKEQQLTKWP